MTSNIVNSCLELIFLQAISRSIPLVCKEWNKIICNSQIIIEQIQPNQIPCLPRKIWECMSLEDKIRHSESLLDSYYESDPFKMIDIPYYIPSWGDLIKSINTIPYLGSLFSEFICLSNTYTYFKQVCDFAHYRLHIFTSCYDATVRVRLFHSLHALPYSRVNFPDMLWGYLSNEFKLSIQVEIEKIKNKLRMPQ